MSFETVLLPVDGSEGTRRAEELAADLADRYGAGVHVLYVVDEAAVPLDARVQQVLAAAEETGRATVEETADWLRDRGVDPVTAAVREGHPHEAILAYAGDVDADLVVMGTHGRRGLERYLLGSVTEKVVRLADVPVLTARIGEEHEDEDGSGEADDALAVE